MNTDSSDQTGSQPFVFWGCSEIRESLGFRADSERQLLERLEVVPSESIYHHTVRCLLRQQVVSAGYSDDFSNWVASEIGDLALAEKLALRSPFDFADTEAFRSYLLDVLDDHLAELRYDPRVLMESSFYFCRGHLAAVPLDLEAHDLASLRSALMEVDDSSLYYHAVEAIGRLGHPHGDFAAWVEESLGFADLARRIYEEDAFVISLSGLRRRLVDLIDMHVYRGDGA
ncbi:MAG: hypothetical protein JXO72_01665 [Vicinamibacteria bacterium]|nr:hypothetical protein [Vicinamibacteria bacterium]